jgi:hypothetical protein
MVSTTAGAAADGIARTVQPARADRPRAAMTDDIINRITAVLDDHTSWDSGCYTWSCYCGVDFHDEDEHTTHVAKVLAKELGLAR